MEHRRAVEMHAVDRYLIGDMSEAERDEFEEHFFSCEECAEDVRIGARFRATARKVLRDPGRLSRPLTERRGLFGWLCCSPISTAAAILLGDMVQPAELMHA